MKNKGYKKEIKEIGNLVNKLSSLNESFRFYKEDEYDEEFPNEEKEDELEDVNDDIEINDETEDEINQIRKICLTGLSKRCDNPESEEYQKLKKIFQMVDKVEKPAVNESKTYYAVNKANKSIVEEFNASKVKNKKALIEMATRSLTKKGLNFKDYKLVSEEKIIK